MQAAQALWSLLARPRASGEEDGDEGCAGRREEGEDVDRLGNLDDGLLLAIVSKLTDCSSVAALSRCSRSLNAVLSDEESVWKRCVQQEWGTTLRLPDGDLGVTLDDDMQGDCGTWELVSTSKAPEARWKTFGRFLHKECAGAMRIGDVNHALGALRRIGAVHYPDEEASACPALLAHAPGVPSRRTATRALIRAYLQEDNEALARAVLDAVPMADCDVLASLRAALRAFPFLPMEAGANAYRVIDLVAGAYAGQNPGGAMNRECVLVFMYALIMLNTDLHNDAVRHKMAPQQWVESINRSILSGLIADAELTRLYGCLLREPLDVGSDETRFPL